MIQTIKNLCEQYFDEVKQIRRHFHENPELSNYEFETSEYIKSHLTSLGITYSDGYAKTGIVAKITCNNPSKRTIAVRAELDALPIQETNKVGYASKKTGVMHACGHDAHMAILLGVAKIINQLKEKFDGTVLLIFQPAEEKPPGGAKVMLDEGALSANEPDVVIAQHVMPELKSGKVAFKPGKYMASVDEIEIIVQGKGGHAAMPHQITDTILMASHIIVALQQIVSRNAQADIPTVLSFGKIIGAGVPNVIPDKVFIEGTLRTMNESWRQTALHKIQQIAYSIASGMGGKCSINIINGYPPLINNDEITRKAISFTNEILGDENVEQAETWMASEDFAYFAQKYPSVFYRLGIQGEHNTYSFPLHNTSFDLDENALKTGLETMCYLIVKFLME